MMPQEREAYQASLRQRIAELHFEGNIDKALNITRTFIMWEQCIVRERIYQLKKDSGISHRDLYGHDGDF